MADTQLTEILRRRESHPQGVESGSYQDSPTGLEGPVFGEKNDFRTAALPSDQGKIRKSFDNGDPYSTPFKVSRVYEINPVGGSGAQYVAQSGEGNGRFIEQLDFNARSLTIDNWTNQYVYIGGARRWLLPLQVNVTFVLPGGTGTIELRFIAPGAKVQPAVAPNQFVIVQAFEAMLPVSSGIVTT